MEESDAGVDAAKAAEGPLLELLDPIVSEGVRHLSDFDMGFVKIQTRLMAACVRVSSVAATYVFTRCVSLDLPLNADMTLYRASNMALAEAESILVWQQRLVVNRHPHTLRPSQTHPFTSFIDTRIRTHTHTHTHTYTHTHTHFLPGMYRQRSPSILIAGLRQQIGLCTSSRCGTFWQPSPRFASFRLHLASP